ncbi:unnamed protein product [Parascedosporium putredinis]|uniref:DUF2433 domain-containing protein n=1 Tax=Parascedosporium putredinis TaxID=1442378 RepID=A0A9P1HB99_9PEZI|nr:unnamed protein product [Parascedosporium putredinis]CAI8004751.1 unnamed protein product [Parascedosporium putredinis]
MAAPRLYNNSGYLPNGATNLPPGAALLPNQGRIIQTGPIRVLCIADVRGNLRSLNDLAKQARADHIIHTGDFGFYDATSLERIAEKTLKHVAQYSPLISDGLPLLLSGEVKLDVPVYTVWGACEDVRVLERFRSGEYKVPNLHIIDEARSMLLEIGGVKLRLLGLGGAVVMHKLFDNGEGRTTIAGGQGTMWTTLLQMGELIDTANRVYDPTETRIFVTHASPAREGILNQLSVTLKADFSISAGLHFRYGSSYNEFSVNPTLDHYRGKLAASKASFNDVWETVKGEVEPAIQQNEAQQNLLKNALQIVEKMPTTAAGGNPFGGPVAGQTALGQVDESAFKNMWNFNLADAAFGWLVLEIQDGRIGTEMRAQGFNFAHRGSKQPSANPAVQPAAAPPSPVPAAKEAEKQAPAANGSTPAPETSASPAPKTPAQDIVGLFIMNVNSDEQARELFADEDRVKILKVEKWGASNKVVQFKTIEDRDAAMARLPDDVKNRTQEDRSKPLVKIFQHRESKPFARGGGAGNWGSSTRGGSSNSGSGYRSAGGGASDSESNRRGGRGSWPRRPGPRWERPRFEGRRGFISRYVFRHTRSRLLDVE